MAVRLTFPFMGARDQGPRSHMATMLPARLPVWPTASIVFLLLVSAIFPPIVMTVMNSALVLLGLIFVFVGKRSLDRRLLHMAVPFTLMLVCGLISGVSSERYLYFKDAWYVFNPILVILSGYIFFNAKPDLSRGLRAFVIGGTIVGIWQLRPYFFDPELITYSAETIRRYVGTGLYAPVLSFTVLVLYLGRWESDLLLPPWFASLLLVISGVSIAAVFSRTALMVVAIAAASLAGAFSRREWLRVGAPMAVLIALSLSLQLFVDTDSDRVLRTFVGKLAHTVQELTVSDYTGLRDINLSYRGHETAQALKQYMSGDIFELLAGRGFGATVDLGVFLPIETNEAGGRVNVRYITTLHNGFAYILTKGGFISLMLFIYFLGYLYFLARPLAATAQGEKTRRAARLLQSIAVTFLTTTYVVAGVFNKQDMFPFLLLVGLLVAYLFQPNRESAA